MKIATKNFQHMFPLGYFILNFFLCFNLCLVNCHAKYKLVGTKLPEIFSSDHSYLFLKTIFTRSLRRNKYSYLRSKISVNFVPTCITYENW
jgi:hypothetical protein